MSKETPRLRLKNGVAYKITRNFEDHSITNPRTQYTHSLYKKPKKGVKSRNFR